MEKVVFLDRATVPIPLPRLSFAHRWAEFDATVPADVVARLHEATVAITNKVPIRAAELERLPDLRLIAVAATGYDCVDVTACHNRGVAVANVPGYSQASVADHTLLLILALRRNLLPYATAVRAGRWQTAPHFALLDYPIHDLTGAILGLVGYGAIGMEVERRAKAYGMEVLISERRGVSVLRPGRIAFDELLARADVVSLHVPLTVETRQLIGGPEIERMKPGAILINTARGGLVDSDAAAAALRSGHLGGVGVDVLPEEPPKRSNPLLEPSVPNVVVTPHVAWSSREALNVLVGRLFGNIEAFMNGRPQNLVQ